MLTEEQIADLQHACLDDSTKIIQYLEEEKKKQRSYNRFVLAVTIAGAIGSVIAAITGVAMFLQ